MHDVLKYFQIKKMDTEGQSELEKVISLDQIKEMSFSERGAMPL